MSTDTSQDQLLLGPVDFLVVEFPGSHFTGEGLPLLVDLVDRGIIRVLDLVFVKKRDDGSVVSLDIGQLDDGGGSASSVARRPGLLGQDDLDKGGRRPGGGELGRVARVREHLGGAHGDGPDEERRTTGRLGPHPRSRAPRGPRRSRRGRRERAAGRGVPERRGGVRRR